MGCEICKEERDLLFGTIETFNDIYLFGKKDSDSLEVETIKEAIEEEVVRVFFDRGRLRLTIGEDINCLDHSIDYVKINYCPSCGREL